MRALILAAGRGERMRPLTDSTPKPLLAVQGRPMIEWPLLALARAGIREVVINTAWLEDQFPAALGDGSRYGLHIRYSMEGRDHGQALETAGGIAKALPLLSPAGSEPFWVISGDIHAPTFAFDSAYAQAFEQSGDLACLWLVPNPEFHPQGDFTLNARGRLGRRPEARVDKAARERPEGPEGPEGQALPTWTYANFGLMRPGIVEGITPGTRAPLGPLLMQAADQGRLAGRIWSGPWHNLGTPEQLKALDESAAH